MEINKKYKRNIKRYFYIMLLFEHVLGIDVLPNSLGFSVYNQSPLESQFKSKQTF